MIHKNVGRKMSSENRIIQKILAQETDEQLEPTDIAFNFEVCIDIGDGRKGILKITEKSDPLECAIHFCRQYELDEVIAGILCQSIKQKIDNQRKNACKTHKYSRKTLQDVRKDDSALRDISFHRMNNSINMQPRNSIKKQKHRTESQHSIVTRDVNSSLEHSHKPKINEISKIITQKLNKKSIVDEVDVNRKKKQMKIEKLKKQIEQKQLSQCSFKPKINIISERVDNEMKKQRQQTSQKKRYEQLYRHSFVMERQKQKQRNKSTDSITFKPEINRISKTIVSGMSFEQRQERFKQHKQEMSTSNHVPRTGRGPRTRNTSNLPIGDYLYEQAKQKQNRNSVVISTSQENQKMVMLGKSQDIVNQLRYARLKEIFDILDHDGDGKIQYDEQAEQILQPQLYQIFLPIFEEMKELDISLDRNEFVQAAQRLLESLTPQQRNAVLNTRKKADRVDNYTFKPQINKTSQVRVHLTHDLYTRGLQDRKKLRDKLEKQKEEQARVELNQCTFKPKIIKYSNPVYFN